MSLALARDKLGYDEEQLASLSRQIRLGDFTPVLRLYEEDIKSPIKSVLTGTLLRSLFVQVQKAKVCLSVLPILIEIITGVTG